VSQRQLVLAVCLPRDAEAKLGLVLGRAEFEFKQTDDLDEAHRLLGLVRFDALLIGSPGTDDDLQSLLGAVRSPESPSAASNVVLLLPPDEMPFSRAYVAAGASQVAPTSMRAADLQATVLRALRAKVRLEVRAMARITVRLDGRPTQLLCQTRDLSRNGMFVVTDHLYPIGTPVQFTLDLTRSGDSIHGEAEVVRQAAAARGRPAGLGLRFVSFGGAGESRLVAFLDRLRN